jgi:hypothetical protein
MLDGAVADETARPNAEDSMRAGMNQALQEMIAFAEKLIEMDVPAEKIWFRNLLIGLLNSTRQNYGFVEIGTTKMPPLASWGARNLLELRVITIYVLRSEADALKFKDDFAADLKEFWEAMKDSSEFVHKKLVAEMRTFAEIQSEPLRSALQDKANEMEQSGPDLTGPVEEMETYRKLMQDFGIDPKRRPSQGSKIAAIVNEGEMFKPRFKIHSKIVHPTALSIAATTMPNSLDALMPLISSEASTDLLAIFYGIKEHVDAHGIAWPVQS